MVALGVKRGWPDLVLPLPGGGIAIEMKSEDGRTTDEQDGWLDWLGSCGWTVAVCRSADEARSVLLTALGVSEDSVPGLPS
jgi:hypothetical protein